MSISSIDSSSTNLYYTNLEQAVQNQTALDENSSLSSLVSSTSASATNADYTTNLEQTAQEEATLAMNPTLAQTLSEQAASPSNASGEEALGMLSGTGASQSSLISLSYSMQLMQSLSASGTLTNNTALAQALLQNYTNTTDISSGSVVNTSA